MSKPKPAPLPAGTVVGGYKIVRKIAAGGFGVVYLAEDDQQRPVALKEYLPSSLAERMEGDLAPHVPPEKLPLYRLGLKSFFDEDVGGLDVEVQHLVLMHHPQSF